MYLIAFAPDKLTSALETWSWIGIEGKRAIRVTAFGDVFFQDDEGIWFLDTVGGKLERISSSESELDGLLATEEGKDRFLLSTLVDRAVCEGLTLEKGMCYDFKIAPVLGGSLGYKNLQTQDLEITLYLGGQIHQQTRGMRTGTKIADVTSNNSPVKSAKPWWKVW